MHTLLPTSEEPRCYSLLSFLEQVIHPIPLDLWMKKESICNYGSVTTTDLATAGMQRHLDDPGTLTNLWESNILIAPIKSFELCKHQDWIEWYHEFVVLTITHEGQEYLIHFNRAWAAPDGWRQYIPPITWGSQKPSHDEVAIYLPGECETAARHSTYVVATFSGSGDLALAHESLLEMWKYHPEYSLIGANCWAFSRAFAWSLLWSLNPSPTNVFIMDRPGPATRTDLLGFLSDSGPWVLIPILKFSGHGEPIHKQILHSVEFAIEVLLHRSKFYRRIRGDPRFVDFFLTSGCKGNTFRRHKKVSVTSSGVTSDSSTSYSGCEIPHSFEPFGVAYDIPTVPRVIPSCHLGDFLYLLTPPVIPPAEPAIPRFGVIVGIKGPGSEKFDGSDTGIPTPWLECGLVRQDDRDGHLDFVCSRTLSAVKDLPRGLNSPMFVFAGYFNDYRPNDMMGVWVRAPPADVASSQWSVTVEIAFISIDWENVFKESRRNLIKPLPRDLPAHQHAVALPSWNTIWPFGGPRSRLEFGRIKSINITPHACYTSPRGSGGDYTWSGVPHWFDQCGLAFDLDTPMHSTTLCQPGDFLYVLTPQIHLAPQNHVLSVTVYTWGIPVCADKTLANPPLSFEVGTVRPTVGGRLEPAGPRYEVSTDFPRPTDPDLQVPTRHRHRMDDNHSFVRSLETGDMIGLWLRLWDPYSGYMMTGSLMVVETGPEVGMVGRYMHFVYDEICEVVLKIELPGWAPAVGAVTLAGALFAGFVKAFRRS